MFTKRFNENFFWVKEIRCILPIRWIETVAHSSAVVVAGVEFLVRHLVSLIATAYGKNVLMGSVMKTGGVMD